MILLMYLLISKFHFLEFWLLLSRVAPYYRLLPRTVWFIFIKIPFFRVLVTIGPSQSLLTARYSELFKLEIRTTMNHLTWLSDQIKDWSWGGDQPSKYEIWIQDLVKFCFGGGVLNFQERTYNTSWYSEK